MTQAEEHLPWMCKTLSSSSAHIKKKNRGFFLFVCFLQYWELNAGFHTYYMSSLPPSQISTPCFLMTELCCATQAGFELPIFLPLPHE
jgi:hypothetical protein